MSNKDSLQLKRDEANKIVTDIIERSKVLESRLVESVGILTDISNNLTQAKNFNSSLSTTIKTTTVTIEKFRKERRVVTKYLNDVNSFYDKKFLPLSAKIEDKTIGLQAKLNSARINSEEIAKIKVNSTTQYNEVKTFANELRKKHRELTSIDTSIRKLWEQSKSNNENSQTLEKSIVQLELKIRNANSEIQVLFNNSSENSKKIKLLLDGSNENINTISKNSDESIKILNEIKKIYDLAAETGLSGEFERQKLKLFSQLEKWEKRIFYTSLSLLVVILLLFIFELALYSWSLKSLDVNFYLRFILFSPIVYYLYFCTSQYTQAKKLHDKYTFKTTLAMSIQNHIKMLLGEEKFDVKAREKILDFVIVGFQKIYSEPYSEEDIKLGLKIQNIEMSMEKKLTEKFNKLKDMM